MAQLKTSSGQIVTANQGDGMYEQYIKGGATVVGAPAPAPAATPTPAPAAPTIAPITTQDITAPKTNVVVDAKKQQQYLDNVKNTYSKYTGTAAANKAFLEGAYTAAGGNVNRQMAESLGLQYISNPADIAKIGEKNIIRLGKDVYSAAKMPTLQQVTDSFGISKYLDGFGVQKPEDVQGNGQSNTKTVDGTPDIGMTGDPIQDEIRRMYNSDGDELDAELLKQSGLDEAKNMASTRYKQLAVEAEKMKNELGLNNIKQNIAADALQREYYGGKEAIKSNLSQMAGVAASKLSSLSQNIKEAYDKMSSADAITNAQNAYNYSLKLNELALAQGDLELATANSKASAEAIKEFKTARLNALSDIYQMDLQTKKFKQDEIDREWERMDAGYTYVPNPAAFEDLIKRKGTEWVQTNTTNIGGKIWIKPDNSKKVVNTIDVGGQLWGINENGEKVVNYGSSGGFSFNTDDNGNTVVTNSKTGEVVLNTPPANATLSIGNGVITGLDGSSKWKYGLDFVLDGGKGAAVNSPFIGEVIFAGENGGFGKQVKIQAADGTEVWLSHLDSINVSKGDNVTEEMVIGTQGNTGDVYSLSGGDGTHLDITMKKPDGSYYSAREVAANLGYNKNSGNLSAYDTDVLVSRIGKQIYGTKISDAESARVEGFIKEGMKQGKSEYEIMDDVLGFKITNKEIKPVAEAMRGLLLQNAGGDGLAGYDMAGLSRLLNDNDLPGAITKVETMIYQNARETDPDGFISESKVKSAIEKGNNLTTYISGLKESPVGVVSGTMENWLGKLKGEEAATIKAQIVSLVAKMRKEFSGSAVTPSEEKFLEPLIPALNDSPANFAAKIEALKNNPLIELNNYRTSFGLSSLDEMSLYDRNARVSTYMEEGASNNNDPLGLF